MARMQTTAMEAVGVMACTFRKSTLGVRDWLLPRKDEPRAANQAD
jgi:hypothetical protein